MSEPRRRALDEEVADELLEAIWTCREDGRRSMSCVLDSAHVPVTTDCVETLAEMGLVRQSDDGFLELTSDGEERASNVIRRHRLAERLLVDILGLNEEQYEELACSFEHHVVPEVADAICTLLGHPETCPHGRPIPPGKDCQRRQTRVDAAVRPLDEAPLGLELRVAYLKPREHDRLHRLLSLGVSPGTRLRVHQRSPVLVVSLGESELAMDQNVAHDVFVWVPTG